MASRIVPSAVESQSAVILKRLAAYRADLQKNSLFVVEFPAPKNKRKGPKSRSKRGFKPSWKAVAVGFAKRLRFRSVAPSCSKEVGS